jgi:hypothetical protein
MEQMASYFGSLEPQFGAEIKIKNTKCSYFRRVRVRSKNHGINEKN